MSTSTERRRAILPPRDVMSRIAAEAYREAALAGTAMQRAVDVIEPFRTSAAEAADAFEVWRAFDAAACLVVNEPLLRVVDGARMRYVTVVGDRACAFVADAFARGEDTGRQEWLRAYGEAVGEFRWPLSERLTQPGWLPASVEETRVRMASATRDARLARWHHVRGTLGYILENAGQEDCERAPLLAMAAEIELHILDEMDSALNLAQEALRRCPDNVRAARVMAAWHRVAGQYEEADRILRACINRAPHYGEAYVELSRCLMERSDLAGAEELLMQGVQEAPHNADIYIQLIRLYSETSLFPKRQGRLPALVAQVTAIDPGDRYSADVAVAYAYSENNAIEWARDLLEQAIAGVPIRVEARVQLARLYMTQDRTEAAEDQLRQAAVNDPADADVPTAYAELYVGKRQWDQALAWAQQAVQLTPGRKGFPLARLAAWQFQAGDREAARQTAIEAVGASPGNRWLVGYLAKIAADAWKTKNTEVVYAIYDPILSALGEPFEAQYHNAIGNAAYSAGDYAVSLLEYERALEKAPDEAVFRRNLAHTLRNLKRWDDAKAALDRVLTSDHEVEAYAWEMALLHNEKAHEAFDAFRFTDAVADYEEAVRFAPDNAVLQGNLASGLERAMTIGKREEHLRRAVNALTKASELDPHGDYGIRRVGLEIQLANVRRFGELILTPARSDPIVVEFGDDLTAKFDQNRRGQTVIPEQLPAMRAALFKIIGFGIPGVRLRSGQLASNGYRIVLFGIVKAAGVAVTDLDCVLAPSEHLVKLGIPAEVLRPARDPVTGGDCAWVPPDALHNIELGDLIRLTDVGFVLRHLAEVVRRNASLFFGLDEADAWMRTSADAPSGSQSGSRDDDHRTSERRLMTARILRAFIRDGVLLDSALRTAVQGSSNGPVSAESRDGAAIVSEVRLALRERLPGNAPDRLQRHLPTWVDEATADGGVLTSFQEQALIAELQPIVDQADRVTCVTADSQARAYLERLLKDGFANVVGVELAVLSEAELLPEGASA